MKQINAVIILIILVQSFYSSTLTGQCGFDIQRSKLQQDPAYLLAEEQAEERIQNIIQNGNLLEKATSIYSIPVVVHVLHLGETVGNGTNISDAQIISGLDRLNEIYRGLDPNSPIDFEIEFSLAQRDPNCNSTTGINRIDASSVTNYSTDGVFLQSSGADENTLKDLSRWPETEYFNIWIVSEIDGNNGGYGIQGYANFFQGAAYEGSVMMYTVFGYDPTNANPSWPLTIDRDNSTVIHEFGHYLHLYHTFEGDGTGSTCPADMTIGTDSDGCADTEIHKRHTSTCPSNNDCNGSIPYGFNTLKNFMSYFSCTDRFTNDQKTRVRAALSNTSIIQSKGHLAPDVNYTAPTVVCSITSPQTNNSGILNVRLNGLNMPSGSSFDDGGSIDKSGSCSGYFEIDATISNILYADIFSVNYQQLGAWIDWNNDGDFNDNAEAQYFDVDIPAGTTAAFDVMYPTNIPYGEYVRLRLITDLDDRYGTSNISSACFTPSYGQSEDYAIHILPNGSLPIELIEFSTTPIENKTVNIKWQTASELNNDYFSVERSKDEIDWKNIIDIPGSRNGNSTEVLFYETMDNSPLEGVSYYRLKQTDFDGNFTYSAIKAVTIDKMYEFQISIYPNPTKQLVTLEANEKELQTVSIYNILGQDITKEASFNQIDKTKLVINLSNLPNGMYLIKTVNNLNKIYKE